VEHFDKGVPFNEIEWQKLRDVPLVSGAVMAFDRVLFQKIGGFSTGYIYGHYEDADLSLRWREANGPVAVHPHLRFVHLEGQGSKVHGALYRGAFMSNRHFFTSRYGELFDANVGMLSKSAGLSSWRQLPPSRSRKKLSCV
jgi:GT2 family glycosyltransferase